MLIHKYVAFSGPRGKVAELLISNRMIFWRIRFAWS